MSNIDIMFMLYFLLKHSRGNSLSLRINVPEAIFSFVLQLLLVKFPILSRNHFSNFVLSGIKRTVVHTILVLQG